MPISIRIRLLHKKRTRRNFPIHHISRARTRGRIGAEIEKLAFGHVAAEFVGERGGGEGGVVVFGQGVDFGGDALAGETGPDVYG